MKLTLRELFLLVVIAAMGCGWWVQYRDTKRQLETAIAAKEATTDALLLRLMSHGGYSIHENGWTRVLRFNDREDLIIK